jgi:DNA-binding transcriptional ArsR family regulator
VSKDQPDQPDEVLEALSPKQAAALAHPTRHRILRGLSAEGATVSQLSHRLRVNKGNVAHHVGVLVDAGLLCRSRTRTVRGGTEQYYTPVARRLRFESGDQGVATRAMLTTIAEEIPRDERHLLHHRTLRMTPRQAQALARHLDSALENLSPAGPGERKYGVLVSVYPTS